MSYPLTVGSARHSSPYLTSPHTRIILSFNCPVHYNVHICVLHSAHWSTWSCLILHSIDHQLLSKAIVQHRWQIHYTIAFTKMHRIVLNCSDPLEMTNTIGADDSVTGELYLSQSSFRPTTRSATQAHLAHLTHLTHLNQIYVACKANLSHLNQMTYIWHIPPLQKWIYISDPFDLSEYFYLIKAASLRIQE